MTQTYNGWTNHATWNVNLWLTNDSAFYTRMMSILDDTNLNDKMAAQYLNNLCIDLFRQSDGTSPQTPDCIGLSGVNWLEIVELNRE